VSIRLQLGTTASQTSIQSFSLQCLSQYSGVALLYSAGLFSTSVINLSLSKILKSRSMMCGFAWNGRRRLLAVRLFCRSCAQAGMFFRVPLPPPTAVRPPHRTENEACCVWKNAAVKQPSVGSLAFKTERFIPAVKKPLRFQPLVCTSPKGLPLAHKLLHDRNICEIQESHETPVVKTCEA